MRPMCCKFLVSLILAVFPGLLFAAPGSVPEGLRAAPGWGVSIAASEPLVINPVTMTFGPDGRLYVVEWQAGRGPNDHIKVLTDQDGDGRFDRAAVFMDGLDLPAGVFFWQGWVYVTLDHDVVRLKDADGDGRFEVREVIASGFGNDNSHHRVSGMTLGPDGWLYLTTGDSDARARGSDGSTATVLRSGGVFRCRPDGSGLETVAFGMRNPWGNVAFDDAFRIVHTDNDNEGTPGFTGCRLLHVVAGGDYGWRLRDGARCCAPEFARATWNGGRPGRLGWIAETGRGAPAGLCVLNSEAFPKSLRNLAVYPDVFRKLVRAYGMSPEGATLKVGREFELLASDDGLFRPTDAEVGPDGALYILDWRTDSGGAGQLSGNGKTGRIYRLTWEGTPEEPGRPTLPRQRVAQLTQDEPANLLKRLSSEDGLERTLVARELLQRGPEALTLEKLAVLWNSPDTSEKGRLHALGVAWALHAGKPEFSRPLAASLVDPDAAVRRFGFELLSRTRLSDGPQQRGLAAIALDRLTDGQESPDVRRAAAISLGRFGGLQGSNTADASNLDRSLASIKSAVKAARSQARGPLGEFLGEIPDESLERISTGLIAEVLLKTAVEVSDADPFFRDGFTRGLEHLGEPAIERLVKAVGGADRRRASAALFALQGWREGEGLDAILVAATESEGVDDEARAGLFFGLRETGEPVVCGPVVRWLVRHPDAGVEPRVRALQLLASQKERAVLDVAPVLDQFLLAVEPEVARAALALAQGVRSAPARTALVRIVRDRDRPGDLRGLALAALRGYEDFDLTPLVREQLNAGGDASFRRELLRTLSSRDFPEAVRLARSLLDEKDREARQDAIAVLGSRPDSALEIARRFNDGRLPREDLPRVIDAVRAHATPELQEVLQGLLKKTVLVAPGSEEARRLRDFVSRNGNPERGRGLFLNASKGGCVTCHRIEGFGGAVGPDLTRVWETLSFDKRLESILEPSKEIKEGFGTFKVATKSGQVLTGLLLGDTPEAVTLRDAQGKEIRILANEIEEKGSDPTSLMPVGAVGHLSLDELADLLAFLGDRAAQESLRPNPPKPGSR